MNRRQLLAATLAASAALYQRPSSAQPPTTPFDFQLSLDFSKIQVNPVGNRFSLELFRVLSDVNRNCIASPLSVLVPMALLAQAAGGNTRSQLRDALHLGDQDDSALRLAGALRGVERSQTVQCKIANALYVQEGTDLQGDFLQLAKDSFGAEVQPAGFKTNHEAVRQEINRWVDQRTGGKIQGLFGPGALDSLTSLVLVNAIYFKGRWANQFRMQDTRPLPFYMADGASTSVPMMHQTGKAGYAENELLQRLELDYRGGEFSGVFLLPRLGRSLAELEAELTAGTWGRWGGESRSGVEVAMGIPKFKLESTLDIKSSLQRLGIVDAFTEGRADFSGMFEPDAPVPVWLSEVTQKAFCEVNEEGTEAAAATGAVARSYSARPAPKRFLADRPFLFAIVHRQSGMILFLSRVNDPRNA